MPDLDDYTIRPVQKSDCDRVLHWRNQDHVREYMFSDGTISAQQHKEWFTRILDSDDSDYQILLFGERPIGLANATRIDQDKHQCHWGFYLGEADAPKGSGSAMARLMLDHLFKHYDIETIIGEVFSFNTASLKLHEKFGFQQLPHTQKTVLKNGAQEPVITLALQRDYWQQHIAKT